MKYVLIYNVDECVEIVGTGMEVEEFDSFDEIDAKANKLRKSLSSEHEIRVLEVNCEFIY